MDVLAHHRGVCTKEKQGAISGSRGIRAAPNSTTKDKKTHLQAFSKSCLSDILIISISERTNPCKRLKTDLENDHDAAWGGGMGAAETDLS
ncbi:MAG: hypothetical protein HDT27_06840 [Subdoligranulum sp.]|nr:hypothetical protein [Subdoligranulum sp.]